jgi:hypothetical protein
MGRNTRRHRRRGAVRQQEKMKVKSLADMINSRLANAAVPATTRDLKNAYSYPTARAAFFQWKISSALCRLVPLHIKIYDC